MPGIVMPVLSEDELKRILEWGDVAAQEVYRSDWTISDRELYDKLAGQYEQVACKVER